MKEKIKLFVFWLGDDSQFDAKRFDRSGFEIILGPSKEEHEYLLNKSSYYSKSFAAKKFSFCSDVWRLYKLSIDAGLYVDASVIIGEELINFINDELIGFDVCAFRGNYKWVESSVLWSGKKNNAFFKNILYKYYFEKDLEVSSFIMPTLLSVEFFKSGFSFGWTKQVVGNNKLMTLNEIRNDKTIWKTGIGSWSSQKSSNYLENIKYDLWAVWQKRFNEKVEDMYHSIKVERAMEGSLIDVSLVRDLYDRREVSHKDLIRQYRKIDYKIKFSERIIWSKLYCFFNSFWRKTST